MKNVRKSILSLFVLFVCLACNQVSHPKGEMPKEDKPFALLPLDTANLNLFYGWQIENRTIGGYSCEKHYVDCKDGWNPHHWYVRVNIYDENETSGYWDNDYNEEISYADYRINSIDTIKGISVDSALVVAEALEKVELFRKMRLAAVKYDCRAGLEVWKDSSHYLYNHFDVSQIDTVRILSVADKIGKGLYKYKNGGAPY